MSRRRSNSAAQVAKTVGVKDIKCVDALARDVGGAIVAYAKTMASIISSSDRVARGRLASARWVGFQRRGESRRIAR